MSKLFCASAVFRQVSQARSQKRLSFPVVAKMTSMQLYESRRACQAFGRARPRTIGARLSTCRGLQSPFLIPHTASSLAPSNQRLPSSEHNSLENGSLPSSANAQVGGLSQPPTLNRLAFQPNPAVHIPSRLFISSLHRRPPFQYTATAQATSLADHQGRGALWTTAAAAVLAASLALALPADAIVPTADTAVLSIPGESKVHASVKFPCTVYTLCPSLRALTHFSHFCQTVGNSPCKRQK